MARPSRARSGGTVATLPIRAFVPAVARVLLTPSVWGVALHQLRATSVPGSWRRPPFVPRPDAEYLRFRTETAYGPGAKPGRDDLVAYLRWCKGNAR